MQVRRGREKWRVGKSDGGREGRRDGEREGVGGREKVTITVTNTYTFSSFFYTYASCKLVSPNSWSSKIYATILDIQVYLCPFVGVMK